VNTLHTPLIWIDMEMSGLDPETCRVLEIATIVTDGALNIVEKGPELIIHQPDEVLDRMDEWNTSHHGSSGLTEAVKASTISEQDAERQTLEFLASHCEADASPLCGNSIGQDRRFIVRYMPVLAEFIHYRSVDVTSFKVMATHWFPNLPPYPKQEQHRALGDICESIAELAYYKERVFREPSDV